MRRREKRERGGRRGRESEREGREGKIATTYFYIQTTGHVILA